MIYTLRDSIQLPHPRQQVFDFFANAENLGRITPPSLGFTIHTRLPIVMGEGTLIDYTVRLQGIPIRWRTRIVSWDSGVEFVDEQLKGPYALWVHRHTFRDIPGGTEIHDEVRYKLPFGQVGRLAHFFVKRQLDSIFRYRQSAIRELLLP